MEPVFKSSDQLPKSLRSRAGWADFLELQRTPEPHLHQIEPTNHCPYSCIMCPRGEKMVRETGFMDMALYEKAIDEAATYAEPVRSKEIELFHFGESLLHPGIAHMVGYASSRGLNVSLSVNAPQLTPALAERILENDPARVIVSLDGFDEESYRRARGEKADYSRAVKNIEALARQRRAANGRTKILVRMIALRANMGAADAFRRFWEAKGIAAEIRPFFPWGEQAMADLGEFEKYPPFMPCPFPWQYLVVQWNGDVVPCCRDYNGVNKMGNLNEATLKDIWNGERYGAFRRQHESGEYGGNSFCRDCMALYYREEEETASGDPSPPGRYKGSELRKTKARRGDAPPPDEDSLSALWRKTADLYGERTYLIDDGDGSSITYAEADRISSAMRQRLLAEGIGPGDRIVLCGPICSEAILLFWAAVQAGAVVVPLDHRLPLHALKEIMGRVSPALVAAAAGRFRGEDIPGGKLVFFDSDESLPRGATPLSDWLRVEDYETQPIETAELRTEEAALILFTSGTTGMPKGVVHSRGALCRSGRLMAETYGWRADDVLISLGDLHTMSGLRNPAVAAVHAGGSVIVTTEPVRGNPIALAECLVRHGATILASAPATLQRFNDAAERLDPGAAAGVRMALVTGAPLHETVRTRFVNRFRIPVYNYYGLTETAGICAAERPGEPLAGEASIGRPAGADVRVADGRGMDAAQGEKGELFVRTPNIMLGYYGDDEATKRVLQGGWFKTGDMATRLEDGALILAGRFDSLMKNRYGEIVNPVEVESCLLGRPDISDAAVFTEVSDRGEEEMAAHLVAGASFEDAARESLWIAEIRRYLLEQLGPGKTPSRFRLKKVIKRSAAGKILREERER